MTDLPELHVPSVVWLSVHIKDGNSVLSKLTKLEAYQAYSKPHNMEHTIISASEIESEI